MGTMLDPYNQPNPAHVLNSTRQWGPSDLGRIEGGKSNQGIFLRECPFIFLYKHVLCRKLENEYVKRRKKLTHNPYLKITIV